MPEFYIIIAEKYFSRILGEALLPLRRLLRLCFPSLPSSLNSRVLFFPAHPLNTAVELVSVWGSAASSPGQQGKSRALAESTS